MNEQPSTSDVKRTSNGSIPAPHSFGYSDGEHSSPLGAQRDYENLFRAVFEQSSLAVGIVEAATGKYVEVNGRYMELIGYSREEMLNMTWMDITHPDDLRPDPALMPKVVQDFRLEKQIIHSDGSVVWIRLTVSPIWNRDGSVTHHLGIIEDITSRKRAEQMLRTVLKGTARATGKKFYHSLVMRLSKATECQFVLLAELIGGGASRARTLAVWAGSELAENFEYDLAGTPCENVVRRSTCVHPRDVQKEFPQDQLLADMGAECYLGTPVRGSDGQVVGILAVLHNQPISDLVDLQPLLEVFADRAATELERERNARSLIESEQRLRVVMDQVPAVLWTTDRDLRFTLSKGVGLEDLGLEPNQVVGQTLYEYFQTDDKDFPPIHKHLLSLQGESVQYDLEWEGRAYRIHNEPLRDRADEIVGTIGVALDVTERKATEEALCESEARFRAIFDSEPECVKLLDKDGRVLSMNAAGLDLIGADSIDQVLGECIYPRIVPEHREKFIAENEKTFSGKSGVLQFEILGLQGTRRWVESHRVPLRNAAGEITASLSVTRDVTERKLAEAAVRESQETLASIASMMPQALYVFDVVKRENVYSNREVWRELGYSKADVERMGPGFVSMLLHPDDLRRMPESLARWDTARDGEILEIEYRMRHANGQWRWFHARDTVFRRSKDGKVEQIIGTAKDITTRKQAEQQLVESETRLRGLVEAIPDLIFHLDRDGHFIDARALSPRDLLLPVEEFISRSYREVLDAPLADQIENAIRAAHRTSTVQSFEYDLDVPGQGHQSYEARVVSDAEGGTVILARNITDLKQAEQERRNLQAQLLHAQKLESLGVLAGGIAHDFNNLLTVMLGYSELARRELDSSSPVHTMLKEIELAAHSAAGLTRNMLAYAGKETVLVESLRIDVLVQEMANLLQTAVSRKARMAFHLKPAPINGDGTQVQQIILNLVTNASDALEDKVGDISIRTGVRDADAEDLYSQYIPDLLSPGKYAYLSVEDTGCGMSEETMGRMFDPFFSTKFSGRGLGLAALLGIVRSHRGTVKVNSAEGRGTTITVLLPASLEELGDEAETRMRSPATLGTILVIEDESAVRRFCRHVLEQQGFHVLTAEDGQQGLDAFFKHPQPIAVLLDVTMPGVDGLEVLARIRQSSNVPIVLMSGLSEQDLKDEISTSDLNDFLQKPFVAEELLDKVCQVLDIA